MMMNTKARYSEKQFLQSSYFSDREVEVLNEMAAGLTDIQIGRKLFLSHYTIQGYRKQLFLKLDAKNSCHLVYKACQMGLI